MSWFASLAPAVFAPFERAPDTERQAVDAPPSRVAASLPVETSFGKPRAKAPAARAKLLPRWEAPSDDEAADIGMDDASEVGDIEFPRLFPSGSLASRQSSRVSARLGAPIDRDEAAQPLSMAPLRSYEEAVLKLKRPGHHSQAELGDNSGDGSDEDEKGPADALAAQLKVQNELKMREKLLEEEKLNKELDSCRENASGVNALSASRVIVSVAKVKLGLMRQKMKRYEEAELRGAEACANLRAEKLLIWVAGLSVLRKFDEKMHLPEIEKIKTESYLMNLEPPPPPPPLEDPPDSEDEELHEKYEAMIHRYENAWKTEGQRVLGKDKFDDIRNMPRNGPAHREKQIVKQKCLEQANEVLNEAEYQELLRKAWRLGDDHAALSEYNPVEFARRVASTSSSAKKV